MREVLFIREGRAASEGGNLVAPLGEEHPDWGGGGGGGGQHSSAESRGCLVASGHSQVLRGWAEWGSRR